MNPPCGKALRDAPTFGIPGAMTDGWIFGYGSLVNRATHDYAEAYTATLPGWRRTWRPTRRREVAFLTVVADPASEIDGLVARIPAASWTALDEREAAYAKLPATGARHGGPTDAAISLYAVPDTGEHPVDTPYRLLLSYIDVVAQGFLREFGEEGVARFFATTAGWEAPVLDDRAAPAYSRAQALSETERALVDRHLDFAGATRSA